MLARASALYSPNRYRLLVAGRLSTLDRLATVIPGLETGSPQEIVAQADMVLLCVQPRHYLDLVDEIAAVLPPHAILVSITNGVTIEAIAERTTNPIVKVVPSVTHAHGRGISLVMQGPRAGIADVEIVTAFFEPFSRPVRIDSRDSRAATNVTGCGPALFALFAMQWVQANEKRTDIIEHAELVSMVTETIAATAAMVDAGTSLEDIVRHAATGGGMTEIALDTLASSLPALLDATVEATFARERALQSQQDQPQSTEVGEP